MCEKKYFSLQSEFMNEETNENKAFFSYSISLVYFICRVV